MRYRPFGHVGQSASAVTVELVPGLKPQEANALVCAALETGVNSYVIALGDGVAAEALTVACRAIDRRALLISMKTTPQVDRPEQRLRQTLAAGLSYADALLLDITGEAAVGDGDLRALATLRNTPFLARLGVWGGGDGIDAQLRRFDFDVLATRYNIRSGWRERNRIKAATERGLSILAFGYEIDAAKALSADAAPKGLRRLFRRPGPATAQPYDFLRHTPGWTPEQISLAFALTEPALASVVVDTCDPARIETLSDAVERELPSAATAQIEIARFAA